MRVNKLFVILSVLLGAAFAQAGVKSSTINALNYMKSIYGDVYAPAPWKAQYDNWDIEAEYQKALDSIQASDQNLTTKEARKILMDFVYSMRDYHVSIRFLSTEQAKLPFLVRSAEGRFFIAHIESNKVNRTVFPFSIGDEVISFNDKPIAEVVDSLKIYEHNVTETDQALAEFALTNRRASRGYTVPKGPLNISIKKKGSEKITTRQLLWEYTPEGIALMPKSEAKSESFSFDSEKKNLIPNPMMDSDFEISSLNPQGLGHKKGFLPSLGEEIWSSSKQDLYHSYIYKADNGEMIGVIRIPGYIVKDYKASVKNFQKIIAKMEKVTDKLVIDQHNNPGGSVFYLYSLVSMLSDRPMQAPRHRMSVDPSNVSSCVNTLKALTKIKTEADAKRAFGAYISGYPVSLEFVKFYAEYCNVMIEDWEKGQTMTRPFWIAGVDKINPSSSPYTKPILILINELDFSGGDFFPTIMQDNQRATIMGVRTAGAGGYVLGYKFPNFLGVETFRVTQSLAYRVDQNPIENLGVTPDIEYKMTVQDRQYNYRPYTKAIKEAISTLK